MIQNMFCVNIFANVFYILTIHYILLYMIYKAYCILYTANILTKIYNWSTYININV